MERLEPVLKQKFWILLGVTLIMAIVGWWMSTSALAKTIAERQSAIEAAFKKVPDGAVPNENWVKELNALNGNQETAIAVAKSASWKQQRDKMMQWPDGIHPSGYWAKFSTVQRDQIRRAYEGEVRRVWKSVDPFDPEDIDGTGVVFYQQKRLYDVVPKPWLTGFKIEDERLWQIKEDLWLLERLFQTIVSVNGGMGVTQNEAVVHAIDRLELRGGGGPKPTAGGAGAGGTSPQGGGGVSITSRKLMNSLNASKDADDAADMSTATESYQPATIENVSAEFDAAEELGADGSSGSRQIGTDGATLDTPTVIKRYVVEDDSLPYKTRGFYLSVKMDHRKIPALIAELTANENTILPIEVMRVQMARLYEDSVSKYVAPTAGAVPTASGRTPFNNAQSRMMRMQANDEDDPSRAINIGGRGGRSLTAPMTAEDRAIQAKQSEISQALATYDKVIADPAMAQVTITGVFILFKKVDDVAPKSTDAAPNPTAAAPGAAPAAVSTEPEPKATATEEPAAPAESQAVEEGATASAASTEEGTPEPTEAAADSPPSSNSEPAGADEAGAEPKQVEPQK